MQRILAIDPGANGGFAWIDRDGIVQSEKMPEGMTAQLDRIGSLRYEDGATTAVLEKVGFHREGNSASASAKFARHCGHIEAALYLWSVPAEDVAPGVWQRSIGVLPKEKAERKRAIREAMQRRYPHLKVTLATADALGILTWAMGRSK